MRFVTVKSAAQQDVQALHRVREQLLKSRTALVNQVRGLLGEHGIIATRGIAHLRRLLSLKPDVFRDQLMSYNAGNTRVFGQPASPQILWISLEVGTERTHFSSARASRDIDEWMDKRTYLTSPAAET